MLFDAKTQDAIDAIKAGRGASDASAWEAIQGAAKAWKPGDYDTTQQMLRAYYEGDLAADTAEAAKVRFPFTAHRMPAVPLNWARLYAENGASVYDWPAKRELVGAEGEPVDPESDEAKAFAAMLEDAQLDPTMAEAERRTKLAKTVFLRVSSDGVEAVATGQPPKTKVTAFWPGDVSVIPHPHAPASMRACVGVIVKVAGSSGLNSSTKTWEFWSRAYEDDATGTPVSFSPWMLQRVTETRRQGEASRVAIEDVLWRVPGGGTSAVYPLPSLPWIVWHDGISDGSPYMEPARNLLPLFRTVNVSMMAEQYAVDMNSATPVIRKTNAIRPTTIALGPGLMPAIPLEDSIEAIAMGADFEGMRAVNRSLLGAMALTNRQRVDGFDIEAQGQPVSGVALKIKGEPQTKARLESVARAIAVEAELLRVMIEVQDYFAGTSIGANGATGKMRPTDPPEYEDRQVTVDRWMKMRDAGLASDAEVRVASGASRTLEEAQAAIDAIKEAKAASIPARMREVMGQGFGQPEEPEEPEDEADPVDTET